MDNCASRHAAHHRRDRPSNRGNLGYAIGWRWWGNSYVPEAAGAVLNFARKLGMQRVTGICDYENARSARVFEKLGLHRFNIVLTRLTSTLRHYTVFR